MKTRLLGGSGLRVSAVGFGMMGLTVGYGSTLTRKEAIILLREAHSLGINFFDTAEAYGGQNEEMLAEAFAPIRDQVVYATKFGWKDGNLRTGELDSRPERIRLVAEQSLRRMKTDRLDLFYQHRVDPKVPIEEVAGAVGDLVKAGKVRYFGLSEAGISTLRRAHSVQQVSVLQSEYSLFSRDLEEKILPALDTLGIGLVPFSPLGKGFLGGLLGIENNFAKSDFRNLLPRFQGSARAENQKMVDSISRFARQRQMTPAQLSLAWLLAGRSSVVPIPGTTNPRHLKENIACVDIDLSNDDLVELSELLKSHVVIGDRYNMKNMKLIDH